MPALATEGSGDTGNASCVSLMHGPPDLRSRVPPTRAKLPVFPSLPGVELKGPRASRPRRLAEYEVPATSEV